MTGQTIKQRQALGGFRQKVWQRPHPLVAKAQTRRQDDPGPTRNAAWLARVRQLPCLACPHGRQEGPSRAHHPRGLFPRTMGRRVSDLLCLPLCDRHHTDGPGAVHNGNEARWYLAHGIEPYGVILSQLAGCRDPDKDEAVAFVILQRERTAA